MILDFKLATDSERNEEIYNQNGYKIEMNPITNNELPNMTYDNGLLYNQTMALFATINKGQLIENPFFGLNPIVKRKMQNSDATGQMYQLSLLEELSDMITEFFLENPEIMNYISTKMTTIEINTEA